MSDFQRIYTPNSSTWPAFPTGLESWGLSGKGQFRSTLQVGRTWEEEYPRMRYADPKTRKFLAYVNQLWRECTIFTISHYHLQAPLGTVSGSLTVNGANQTGSTLNIHAITGTLKAGDVISIAGINYVFDVTADVANGATSISISPPIFAGNSPADNAVITYTAVKFRAKLTERLALPKCKIDQWYEGLTLKFRECP